MGWRSSSFADLNYNKIKVKGTLNFYNKFSFLYPIVDFFLRPQKKMLAYQVNKLPIGDLLEIGVGNGSQLSFYKNHHLTGIDISTAMLTVAKKRSLGEIELFQMDAEQLSFKAESFDYVVVSHLLAVLSNPDRAIVEAHRVLKPGGKLFILNHFTPTSWLGWIDRGFAPAARLFHFQSVFRVEDLPMRNFTLERAIDLGRMRYFKLLTYRKN